MTTRKLLARTAISAGALLSLTAAALGDTPRPRADTKSGATVAAAVTATIAATSTRVLPRQVGNYSKGGDYGCGRASR
jgi:hypothetical protein